MMDTTLPAQSGHRSHSLPLLILFLLSLASAVFSWNIGYEYRWTSDTTDTFYRIVSSLTSTPATAPGLGLAETLWREMSAVVVGQPVTAWYQGLFDAYLRAVHLAWGDISLAYKIQVFPLTLLFSLGAYLFFHQLTGNRWIALGLAIAALLPMPLSWAGERSGLGPIWSYTRRYFLTACLPLLAMLYFRGALGGGKILLLAMIAAGLASSLHASGIILLQILALAWLVFETITSKRLLQAGGLLALGLLFSVASMGSVWDRGVLPIARLLFSAVSTDSVAGPLALMHEARNAIPEELRYLFYPPKIYGQLPAELVDLWLLATIVLSLAPLILRGIGKREHSLVLFLAAAACLLFVSFERMWVWVALAALLYGVGRPATPSPAYTLSCYVIISNFWVAVVGMLLFQAGYALIESFPLVVNQLRGIRFMGLWVFAWIAAMIVPALPALKLAPRLRRTTWVVVSLAVLVLSQTVYRQYFRTLESDRMERKRALLEIAAWAKRNTAPASVFLIGYSSFGVVAERAVTHTDKTVRNAGIEWLPPKGMQPPADQLASARQFSASHLLLAPTDVSPCLAPCILVANDHYALAETQCVGSALAPPGAESAIR